MPNHNVETTGRITPQKICTENTKLKKRLALQKKGGAKPMGKPKKQSLVEEKTRLPKAENGFKVWEKLNPTPGGK